MATSKTSFTVNHPLAVKLWCKMLERDVLQRLFFKDLIGDSGNAIIYRKRDLEKSQGDRVRFRLRSLLSGDGKTEGEVLEGNEEALVHNYDDIYINELRHAVDVPGAMSIDGQRYVGDNLRQEGMEGLSDWFVDRMEQVMFNHLCGNSKIIANIRRGNNAILAPSSGRIVRANGEATDQALASGDEFKLSILDAVLEKVETVTPTIRPGNINGQKRFVCFIHPYQATDLCRDSTSGQWLSIQLARLSGGQGNANQLLNGYDGYLGPYKNIDIYVTKYVPTGVNSSTGADVTAARRAVLCGRSAACVAFGKGVGSSLFSWVEIDKDYESVVGIAARTVYGMKKTRYTSDGTTGEDFGVITIPTYAVAHTY